MYSARAIVRATLKEIRICTVFLTSVVNPHLDADPGPAFHFNADLDPSFAHHRSTANVQLLAFRPSLQSGPLCLHSCIWILKRIRIRMLLLTLL